MLESSGGIQEVTRNKPSNDAPDDTLLLATTASDGGCRDAQVRGERARLVTRKVIRHSLRQPVRNTRPAGLLRCIVIHSWRHLSGQLR